MAEDELVTEQLPERYRPLVSNAREYIAQSLSDATKRAYRQGWQRFAGWCSETNQRAMPASPSTIALWVTSLADEGAAMSTIRLYLVAVGQAHKSQGHDSPVDDPRVRQLLQGVPRVRQADGQPTAPKQARALTVPELRAMCEALPADVRGLRDRAMLLVAFAAALRRSEVVALRWRFLEDTDDGVILTIPWSKVDAEGEGARVGIPFGSAPATCPVRALRAWRERLFTEWPPSFEGELGGPVFPTIWPGGRVAVLATSPRAVERALERAADWGQVPTAGLSAHSLRAGLATAAARAGKDAWAIMRQGRWSSRTTVDRYVREAEVLGDGNAAAGIGL